jgi:catechol 2,3-dioxygenase-like lactoylglutathione lyase family enzyme
MCLEREDFTQTVPPGERNADIPLANGGMTVVHLLVHLQVADFPVHQARVTHARIAMPTLGFSHYNLRAPRPLLESLRSFYCEVVGLTVGHRPPFASFGYWLYAGDRDVLHLSEAASDEGRSAQAIGTFDHAAFACEGRDDYEQRLARRGVAYQLARVPATRQVQLFFKDPAGNGVELNFSDED